MNIKDNIYLAEFRNSKILCLKIDGANLLEYQLEMVNNNKEIGILEIAEKQFNSEIEINYDVTEYTSLKKYIKESRVTKKEFLEILKNIMNILEQSAEYFLSQENYLLEISRVYIHSNSKSIALVYIPLDIKVTEDIKGDLISLIKEMLNCFIENQMGREDKWSEEILRSIECEDFDIKKFNKNFGRLINLSHELPKKESKNIQNRVIESEGAKNYFENSYEKQKQYGGNQSSTLAIILIGVGGSGIVGGVLFLLLKNKILFLERLSFLFIGLSFISLITLVIGIAIFIKESKKENNYKPININNRPQYNKNNINEYSNKSEKRAVVRNDIYNTTILEESKTRYLLYDKDGVAEKVLITKYIFLVGRLKGKVDLVISSPTVGKEHAKFIRKDDRLFLVDLESKNGTFINGKRLVAGNLHILKDNDKIIFAKSEFRYREM